MEHRAGVYVRISQDRDGGGAGVKRQEQDCRAHAERLGWEVGGVYRDNDISAFAGKPRPAFERMKTDLKDGEIDAIVCWHPDRLTRSPLELEGLINLIEATGAVVATVQAGDIDVATASGRMIARVVGAMARHESEQKGERIRRQRLQAAQEGRPHGGRRAFGYEKDGLTIREDEAALVREAAARYIAGESLRAIAFAWNARAIKPTRADAWTTTSLRSMLGGARIAGLREHHGEVIGDAQWPAIISIEDHERIRAVLGNPRRSKRGRPPSRLLSGFLRCGRCGATLSVSRRISGNVRYMCVHQPGRVGCGRVAIAADDLEQVVTEAVLIATDGPDLRRIISHHKRQGERSALAELARAEAKLEQLARDHAKDRITRREWLAAKGELDARISELRSDATQDALSAQAALEPFTKRGALRAAWPDLGIDRQRAVLAAIIDFVTIKPATRPGRHEFEEERIDITWRA
jgi:DNA invertase Pin-like site-specific DNA recombinase